MKKQMTKSDFTKCVILSSVLTAAVLAATIIFCALILECYSAPNETNTHVGSGVVTDVYLRVPRGEVRICFEDSDDLWLVYPHTARGLYKAIGYTVDELSELLEGKTVEYRRMDSLCWAVELNVGGIVIDNSHLTAKEAKISRIAAVGISLIISAAAVGFDFAYLRDKHSLYTKAEKKRKSKARREMRKLRENK